MNRIFIVALAASVLTACGGGGGGGTPNPLPSVKPSPTAQGYALQLHWEFAANAGLSAALHRQAVVRMDSTGTVVVQSPNGGQSPFDTSSPAYVTVSVSPQPSPGAAVQITTDATNVNIEATPQPAQPNPSASPAALVVGQNNATDSGTTITASLGTSSTTNPLLVIPSLALVAPSNGSTPVAPDAIGFSFDSNCNAVPQNMTAAADVYMVYSDVNSTLNFPGGGVALQNGYDVSTLSASQWSNNGTSINLNTFGDSFYDTLIFKTSTGRIVYISANGFGGANPSSSGAFMVGGYGCLN